MRTEPVNENRRMMSEDERLAGVYEGYRSSEAKQRAWRAANPGNAAMLQELLARAVDVAAAELDGPGRVLDAGCGGGRWLEALARHGVREERLHGVDLLPGRVSVARRRVPGADVREADIRALPYPDAHFALVLLFTALSSLACEEAVRDAVREARRVMEPAGLVLVYEPRVRNPINRSTVHVKRAPLAGELGAPVSVTPLTLLPPLARRLGRLTGRAYPVLARGPLRTHALSAFRPRGPA